MKYKHRTPEQRYTIDVLLCQKKSRKDNIAEKTLAQTVILMMLPYIGKIRSITTDNGSEFAEHLLIAKRLKTKIFFAHPYSSWEKGCIEYHNKLIRQYIPKGTDLDSISDQMLKGFIIKINKRPRLKLTFSSPVVEFFKFIA